MIAELKKYNREKNKKTILDKIRLKPLLDKDKPRFDSSTSLLKIDHDPKLPEAAVLS